SSPGLCPILARQNNHLDWDGIPRPRLRQSAGRTDGPRSVLAPEGARGRPDQVDVAAQNRTRGSGDCDRPGRPVSALRSGSTARPRSMETGPIVTIPSRLLSGNRTLIDL